MHATLITPLARSRALLLSLLISGFAPYFVSAQGWLYEHPALATDVLTAIGFTGAGFGVIAGRTMADSALILTTNDGGLSWQRSLPGFSGSFNAVSVLSPSVWAVAGDTSVFITHDGGGTWLVRTISDAGALRAVVFLDSLTGFAAGSRHTGFALLARTTDGGLSWSAIAPSGSGTIVHPIRSIAFANASVGVAVGDRGTLWRTTDRGATWNAVTLGQYSHSAVAFNSAGVGLMAGDDVMRSTNLGAAWALVGGAWGSYSALAFGDDAHAAAAGVHSIGRSTDGGVSWVQASTDIVLRGIGSPAASTIYASGDSGAAVRFLPAGSIIPPLLPAFPADSATSVPITGNMHGTFSADIGWHYYPYTSFNIGAVQGYDAQFDYTWADNPDFISSPGMAAAGMVPGRCFQDTAVRLERLWPSTTYYWYVEHRDPTASTQQSEVRHFTTRDSLPSGIRSLQEAAPESLSLAELHQKDDPSYWLDQAGPALGRHVYVRAVCSSPATLCANGQRVSPFAADPTGTSWGGVMLAPATTLDYPSRQLLNSIQPGDLIEAQGIMDENPAGSFNSMSVLTVRAVRKIGSNTGLPPAPIVQVSDFRSGASSTGLVRYTTGEQYEGMRVEMHHVNVHSVADSAAGTIVLIDGEGNQITTSDYFPLYTLGPRRDPSSTYAIPPSGAVIDTIRGMIVTDRFGYHIAPMERGDIVYGAPRHGAISGTVFQDRSHDGTRQPAEPGAGGMEIDISGRIGGKLLTAAEGTFALTGLDTGTYTLTFVPPLSWSATTPSTLTCRIGADDSARVLFGAGYPWNAVSGRLYRDWNEDGRFDEDDAGISGWTIRIVGTTTDSTVTDSAGNYLLDGVFPGNGYVTAEIPGGWEQTAPIIAPGYPQDFHTFGETYPGRDFGIRRAPQRAAFALTIFDNTAAGRRTITGGIRPGATYGIWGADPSARFYDYSEGETEIPPQINGLFDARFEDPHGGISRFGYGSWVDMRDFRSADQIDSFLVSFAPAAYYGGNYPMALSWPPGAVAAAFRGPVTLSAPGGVQVDMKSTDHFIAPDPSVSYVVITTSAPNLPSSTLREWHLISLAEPVRDSSISALFPSAAGHAFAYAGGTGYRFADTLAHGSGYWMRYSAALDSIRYCGPPCTRDTLAIRPGWNLIGSESAPAVALSTDPPGLLAGRFFAYNRGYIMTDTLLPGRGHWVKGLAPGKLIIGSAGPGKLTAGGDGWKGRAWRLSVSAGGGARQDLFILTDSSRAPSAGEAELPPVPPAGVFDARFSTGQMLALATGREETFPLRISAPVVQFRWTAPSPGGAAMEASLLVGGQRIPLGPKPAGVTLGNDGVPLALQIVRRPLPSPFALEQNFPNPFNPSTTVRYSLPVAGRVAIRVYDLLGREVRLLVDETLGAGFHSVVWDGRISSGVDAAGGVYFCVMSAAPERGAPILLTRKMLLLK